MNGPSIWQIYSLLDHLPKQFLKTSQKSVVFYELGVHSDSLNFKSNWENDLKGGKFVKNGVH